MKNVKVSKIVLFLNTYKKPNVKTGPKFPYFDYKRKFPFICCILNISKHHLQ